MYSNLNRGTAFEMQGGEGGRAINTDLCTLQSMEVVLLNQHSIDLWIFFFFPRKENGCEVHFKKAAYLTSFSVLSCCLVSELL